MIFSSPIFIVLFLPIVLAIYYIGGRKNIIILIASILFYAWGEFHYVILLIISIWYNYLCGTIIARTRSRTDSPIILYIGIAGNLGLLGYFKYASFFINSINPFVVLIGLDSIPLPDIHLPLGISFFTFQAITYLVDTYRGHAAHPRNVVNLALYISFFPQLIAGPIVRYHEIAEALEKRLVRLNKIYEGVERFVIGMAKKLIIADTLAVPADKIFGIGASELTPPLACFGAICFSLQIFFDFSGYSDMAIGLGRMFGFHFPENFNYPYISKSIREFWHRWHMTLSRFFRDYLYITIGGNRYGPSRTYLNLLIVFFLCGLWHGDNWTYVFWGFFHGLFLILERAKLGNILNFLPDFMRHIYVLFIIFLGWIIFRSPSIHYAMLYMKSLFSINGWNQPFTQLTDIANNYEIFIAVVGCICSIPVMQHLEKLSLKFNYLNHSSVVFQKTVSKARSIGYVFIMGILFIISFGAMSAQTYKAFIYFRF